jgi:hypothetical protein
MRFYLGTHEVHWLASAGVPLFVSRIRLGKRKRLPRAVAPWALDSGGFTELNRSGRWSIGPKEYAALVRLWRQEIGGMEWAAIQDWMCEAFVLEKTGKTVADHQALTIRSYADLTDAAPELPWVPVLQGWAADDYLRHADDYQRAGFDLSVLPLVGLGSICRRQGTAEASEIIFRVASLGIRLHGFGFKAQGLARNHDLLASADSLAWSYQARRNPGLPECRHKSCANCLPYALRWRDRLLSHLPYHGLFHGMTA